MRVCFLTHYYPPEVGAPQTRIELLARELSRLGLEVSVHTGFPHYPDGVVKAPYRNRPWLRERRHGVSVVRSAVYPAPNQGFTRRILDHGALAASMLATQSLTGPLDLVVAETPPLFTAAAGAVYAARKGAAFVVNVADRWPASAVELGALRSPRAIATAERLERWIYRRADGVLAPTDGLTRALDNLPEASGKCRRTWPVVDLERFASLEMSARRPDRPLQVLYAGTVGLAHGLDTLVRAAGLAGQDVVRVRIAGDGAELAGLRELVRQSPGASVELLGSVAAAAIPQLYGASDAAAVLLRDRAIFRSALPTKLLEAMAAGRPLVVAARGEAAELVRVAGAGLTVAPEDPAGLGAALRRLHAEPELCRELGAGGRRFVHERFGVRRAGEEWAARLSEALASRRARRAPAL